MNLSIAELWHEIPLFAKFIWFILAAMSVWSLTVAIGKWWSLRKAQKETIKFAPEFSQFLEEDNLTEAIKLAEGYKKSHVARVLGGALAQLPQFLGVLVAARFVLEPIVLAHGFDASKIDRMRADARWAEEAGMAIRVLPPLASGCSGITSCHRSCGAARGRR